MSPPARAGFLGTAVAFAFASAFAPSAGAATARASGSVRLSVPDAFVVSGVPVTVPGRSMHVQGLVRPYVPGEWVTVRVYLGRQLIKRDRLRVKPVKGRRYGAFTEGVSSPGAGTVQVIVRHHRSAAQQAFRASQSFTVLSPQAGYGATGQFVQLIQQRLAALHFYVPQTGVYDSGTALALDAYHRLLHWGTYQTLDGRTISYLLDGFGAFPVRYPDDGRHAEGNLGLQLVALIDGMNVQQIYPISSGKPSTPTILGRFHVYSRVPGYLPDGMYYSDFFTGAYALHGYDPAPDYPASHGCMRLPIQDAISAFDWLALGDAVDVYQ